MGELLDIGSYVELLKLQSALAIRKQAKYQLSTVILPTFNLGQAVIFERLETINNFANWTGNSAKSPSRSQFWTSLYIYNNSSSNYYEITITNDDNTTLTCYIMQKEIMIFNNVRIKNMYPTSTNADLRVLGGY